MEKRILERYEHTDDGKVVIDIAAGKIEDLYDDFDRYAPYLKKDLHQDLVDYLIDSAHEIGKDEFAIVFTLQRISEDTPVSRVRMSISRYFLYLKELEFRKIKKMVRTSFILFAIGITILSLSIWFNETIATQESVFNKVFAEGLTIAAWVSLWEALATFLINWTPHQRQIKLYERIANAPVLFRTAVQEKHLYPRS